MLAQLREQVEAEQAAAAEPGAAPRSPSGTARRPGAASLARRRLGWQTVLVDGIQDLTTDVDHDLRERLRAMVRKGEALLDAGDPRDTWRDFQAWAAREATAAAVDNLFALVGRTEQLARDVAERFDLEYDSLDLDLPRRTWPCARSDGLEVSFDNGPACSSSSARSPRPGSPSAAWSCSARSAPCST